MWEFAEMIFWCDQDRWRDIYIIIMHLITRLVRTSRYYSSSIRYVYIFVECVSRFDSRKTIPLRMLKWFVKILNRKSARTNFDDSGFYIVVVRKKNRLHRFFSIRKMWRHTIADCCDLIHRRSLHIISTLRCSSVSFPFVVEKRQRKNNT